MSTILLVEDDPQIRRFVRLALQNEDCQVRETSSVAEGLAATAEYNPDLVILDLGLPGGDGLGYIAEVRRWADMPILVLSARSLETDKVTALDRGADDYLAKPFGVAELLARVRALLRRRITRTSTEPQVSFGEVVVDLARRKVYRAGTLIHLTPIEYRLLTLFISQPDRVLTQRQILTEVWGPNNSDDNHYLRVYVGRLRHKVELDPTQPRHLLTETGVGYRFVF